MYPFRSLSRAVAAVSAVVVASALAISPAGASSHHPAASPVFEVQTYNMDFGGDLSALFNPSNDLITATSTIWAQTVASDIPARAAAVARQIARHQPDLVGLQEVSKWRTAPAAITGSGLTPTGGFTTDYDSLVSLLAALAALGTPYRAVAVNTTFSNEAFPLPAMTATGLRLVAFTDYNVILVRTTSLRHGRMRVGNTQTHTYGASLPVTVAGQPIAVTRGWASVDVTTFGRTFRFVDTHLEAYGTPPIKDEVRNPQAAELAGWIADSGMPVVLVGDINARPDMCRNIPRADPFEHILDANTVAYTTLTTVGHMREVWPVLHRRDPCGSAGWTSGQSALDNPVSTLTHRIDDVFVTRQFTPLVARVMGATAADRTPSGLWPSDHASTWAQLRLGPLHR